MPDGLIVKAVSGYYYVQPFDHRDQLIQCRARGIFKKRDISPLVGDHVQYVLTENGGGWIQFVQQRRNQLVRPPIANVDLAVLVFSIIDPELSLQLLDKFLVHVEQASMDVVICLSKSDLAGDLDEIPEMIRVYEQIGYPMILTSAHTNEGIDRLRKQMNHRISVFCGQSGVGKSSLLNSLFPEMVQLKTAEVSKKLGRGKHTTRHVELFEFGEQAYVADTPGFSQLDFEDIEAEDLFYGFKEMRRWHAQCKFRGCLHQQEPECAVREAWEAGEIVNSRYQSYIHFLQQVKAKKRRY